MPFVDVSRKLQVQRKKCRGEPPLDFPHRQMISIRRWRPLLPRYDLYLLYLLWVPCLKHCRSEAGSVSASRIIFRSQENPRSVLHLTFFPEPDGFRVSPEKSKSGSPCTCARLLPPWVPVGEDMKACQIIVKINYTRGDHIRERCEHLTNMCAVSTNVKNKHESKVLSQERFSAESWLQHRRLRNNSLLCTDC